MVDSTLSPYRCRSIITLIKCTIPISLAASLLHIITFTEFSDALATQFSYFFTYTSAGILGPISPLEAMQVLPGNGIKVHSRPASSHDLTQYRTFGVHWKQWRFCSSWSPFVHVSRSTSHHFASILHLFQRFAIWCQIMNTFSSSLHWRFPLVHQYAEINQPVAPLTVSNVLRCKIAFRQPW